MFVFDKIDTVPFWKKIYQTASGYSPSVTNDIVEEILKITNVELKQGYSIYETYTDEDFQSWEKGLKDKDEELTSFFKRLCKILNLKPKVALPVFFNYLMFEYYGKVEDIKNLILYEHSVLSLLENVWQFYSSERMYYVKTLRHVFEGAVATDNCFKNEYVKFVRGLNMLEFRKMLISQLRFLINEITEKSLDNSFDRKTYVDRNNREQLEFILLIAMTIEYKEISIDEFTTLLDNFLLHNFTRQPVYFDTTLYGDPVYFDCVKCAEIGCFILGIHQIGEKIDSLSKTLEASLKDIQNQGNHKIILFSWVVGKLKMVDENDMETVSNYEKLLRILIEGETFNSIAEFLASKLMKTEIRSTKLMQAGIYKLLNEFFIAIDNKQILVQNNGLIKSLLYLMNDPEIAAVCTTAEGGLDVIVRLAFEQFPDNFLELTKFSKVLVKHKSLVKPVVEKLNNLNPKNVSESFNVSYEPQNNRELKTNEFNSYFKYLEMLTKKLCQSGVMEEEALILEGFKLIHEIIKNIDGDLDQCGFGNCVHLLNYFMNVHGNLQSSIPFVKIYFQIHSSMVSHQNSSIKNEFQGFQMARQFLPQLKTQDKIPEILMQRHIIDSLLLQILRKEEYENIHPTIRAYLDIIFYCVKNNTDFENVQLPGMIYIMNFVFPYHKNWQYGDVNEQVEISVSCLKSILEIFNRNSPKDKNDILKSFLFHSLLKNPPVMNSFLQYLIQEKFFLQRVMLDEVDWIDGKTLKRITLSKLHLSVFLRILNDCNLKPSDAVLKPKIQTITKCAASFITNAFSSSLATLACRLLEKLSQDPDIPILAVLEMDFSQIQCLFLEKLRDPLEDDIFKMTALDFINTSLLSQNGLTAAFFNAQDISENNKNAKKTIPTDSVCDFMIDYLQNIQKSSDYLTNPVQKSILRVFSTLWSTGRENLVKDIYSLKCFWPLLTDPFFHPRIKDPEVYTHIMTITTIHIMEFQKNVDKNLKQVITNFFKNEKLIDEWIDYLKSVLSVYRDDEQYKESTQFIFAWKKMIISIKTYIPEVITLDTVKLKLILSCLKGILWHFSVISSNEIITDFSDLYLILTFTWPESYKNEMETIDLLTTVLSTYITNCKFPSSHNREVFLTMVHKTIKDCKELIESHQNILYNLLKSVGLMMDEEYNRLLLNHGKNENGNGAKLRCAICWVLVARIGDSILSLSSVKPFSTFFKYHQYLPRMLDSIKLLLNDKDTFPMVKMLMNSLINYAESDIAMDFLSLNSTVIYDIIDNGGAVIFPSSNREEFPINLKEQWILYTMVIKLNHILLNKFGEKMTESNFTFLSVYDRIIAQMICLPEVTVENRALDLSCETLRYIDKILERSDVWSVKNISSFSLIVISIKRVLNTCISTILRPENIHFYEINKLGKLTYAYESIKNSSVAKVTNRLLELSCLALRCLIKCNPSMPQLLSIEKPKSHLYQLIEYDFTIPKFDISVTEDLTYGRLLCIIYFLCKTLNNDCFKSGSQELDRSNWQTKEKICLDNKNNNKTQEKCIGEMFGKFTLLEDSEIGFIVYPKSSDLISQPIKLSAFLHYGEQSSSEPWIKSVCKEKVQTALEFFMTFLAVQVFFHVKTLQKPQLHYFKRELYSELQFFNEFVRKVAADEYNKVVPKRKTEPQNVDIINRLLSEKMRESDGLEEICDNFFLLAISKWFINICQLS